ncbi:ROK family protein [Candidatus Margulisiibacteriota bacterium]
MKNYLGIDIGGTKIGFGILKNKKLTTLELPTETNKGSKQVLKNIECGIHEILKKTFSREPSAVNRQLNAAGVGIPGIILPRKQKIVRLPNLKCLEKINTIKKITKIVKKYSPSIHFENDANAAALGEAQFGRAKKFSSFVYLTVSTGIGGGIVIDNKIVDGIQGYAGEIGHIVLEPNGSKCGCGKRGCLEAYASGESTEKIAKRYYRKNTRDRIIQKIIDGDPNNISTKTLSIAYKKGSSFAKVMFDHQTNYIAQAIDAIINIIDPEAVIIGGGVAQAGKFWFNIIRKKVKKLSKGYYRKTKILPSKLGKNTGILGAIAVAIQGENQ